jgi:hypothetical protein
VKELRPLTPEEFARAEQRLLHPAPGSRIEAAQKFGIDLTLLIEQLRHSPAERLARLEDLATDLESLRGAARRRKCN